MTLLTDRRLATGACATSIVASAAEHDHSFGSGQAYSLGVEEELFLVDPVTGRQTNSSAAVLERLGGTVERELHACQIELITNVHSNANDAVGELAELRRAVVQTGAALLGSGTHPAADEGDAVITDKERYERIHFLLGDAVVTPGGGLHIHVGMPGSELVHCLDAAEREPMDDPPPELVEEGMFRAARFGVRGALPDAHGTCRPVSELLEDALERADPWAREPGCVEEIARLPELLQRGGGATCSAPRTRSQGSTPSSGSYCSAPAAVA